MSTFSSSRNFSRHTRSFVRSVFVLQVIFFLKCINRCYIGLFSYPRTSCSRLLLSRCCFWTTMSPRKESVFEKDSRLSYAKSEPIDYNPVGFLRCHSRKNFDVDRTTRVWKSAFKPDGTNTVATCGGNSAVIIDAEDGSVLIKHYAKQLDEDFTALAWTTVTTANESYNILAFAGIKRVLHLLHADRKVCIAEHSLRKKSSGFGKIMHMESLMFHPELPTILFGVFTDGSVHVWDIGSPHPPEYKSSLELLKTLETNCPANALAFSTHNSMLLCATQQGAIGWYLPSTSLHKKQEDKQLHFVFSSTNENLAPEDKYYVDSIEVFKDGKLIATKCALHGCIYIWDLEKAIQSAGKSNTSVRAKKTNPVIVTPLHMLKWSDTDNFYMIVGISQKGNILACGDDKGNVWLYDLDEILASPSQEHDCSKILQWPVVEDDRLLKKKMLVYYGDTDIVVNQVSLNYDASFLVAVTSTNTVCIWKRVT